MSKIPNKKFSLWLSVLVLCLMISCLWLGYRQVLAQKRTAALFDAIRREDISAIQRNIREGADPNSLEAMVQPPTDAMAIIKQVFKDTLHPPFRTGPLSAAVETRNPAVIHTLLDSGARPDCRDSMGGTALMDAAKLYTAKLYTWDTASDLQKQRSKQKQIILLLLHQGAAINATDLYGGTALSAALNNGSGMTDLTIVEFLLDHGADANVKTGYGETLFQGYCTNSEKKNVPIINLLLEHGANVNAPDSMGWTPLMRASEWMEPTLVETLLKYGANPNTHSPANDMTPLIQAARQKQIGIMKILLDKGADVNAFSKYDSNALYIATTYGRADMVKLLLEHGANPNFCNEFELRDPALVIAAMEGNAQIVRLLLAHGADVNERSNDSNLTAEDAAMKYHHLTLLPLLRQNPQTAQ